MSKNKTLRFTVDHVSCADIDLAVDALGSVPIMTLGPGAYTDLVKECGGFEPMGKWALALATRTNKVIAMNIPTGHGNSTTLAIGPERWSQEQLNRFMEPYRPMLEKAFG